MNRRGEKYLSVYWFVILAIVAGGIIAMVFVFYGKPYDIREIEANVMTNKIADCLSDDVGGLRSDVVNEIVLEECGFVLSDDFYFEVNGLTPKGVPPSTEKKDIIEEGIKQGNPNLKDSCGKGDSVVCVDKNVYYLGGGKIKILSVVREHENK